MVLVESGRNIEQVSLMMPNCIENCISVMKMVLIERVNLFSSGLYSGTLLYLYITYIYRLNNKAAFIDHLKSNRLPDCIKRLFSHRFMLSHTLSQDYPAGIESD